MMTESEKLTLSCAQVWGGNRSASAELSLPGLDTYLVSQPHDGAPAGGDVYYVSSCGTGRITRIVLADVSGHGSSASHLAGVMRGFMQRFLNHIEPVGLATALNEALMGDASRDQRFATALIMTFFSPSGSLSICNAGHPLPLVYRARQNRWSAFDQPDTANDVVNLPLGVLEDTGYEGRELVLHPGDVVLAYTDGLTETRDQQGNLLGTDALLHTLQSLVEKHGPEITHDAKPLGETLLTELRESGYTLDDDITLVISRCSKRSGGSSLGGRIGGLGRSMQMMLTPGSPTPWPELNRKTVSVSAIPPLPGKKK